MLCLRCWLEAGTNLVPAGAAKSMGRGVARATWLCTCLGLMQQPWCSTSSQRSPCGYAVAGHAKRRCWRERAGQGWQARVPGAC